jgi:hypothetical protein
LRASSHSYSSSNNDTHIDRDTNFYSASSYVHAYAQRNADEFIDADAHVITHSDADSHANIYANSFAHSNPVANSAWKWSMSRRTISQRGVGRRYAAHHLSAAGVC